MERKKLDMIVFNDISRTDIGFDSDYNEVRILTQGLRGPAGAGAQGDHRRAHPGQRRPGRAGPQRGDPAAGVGRPAPTEVRLRPSAQRLVFGKYSGFVKDALKVLVSQPEAGG